MIQKKAVERKRSTVPQRLGKVTVSTRKGQTVRKLSPVRVMKGSSSSEPIMQSTTASRPGKSLLRIPLRTRQIHETKREEKTTTRDKTTQLENNDRPSEPDKTSLDRSPSLSAPSIPHPSSSIAPPVQCLPPHPSYSGLHPWQQLPTHFYHHPASIEPAPNLHSYPSNPQFYPVPAPPTVLPTHPFTSYPTLSSMRERPPASKDTANPPAFYPSAAQQHIFTAAGTQERREEYTTPVTSSASNTKELCDQREEVLHQGPGARQENTHVSSSFPNCPISSSSGFLSQEHNPDSIYQYYTQTRSPAPALQPKVTFSLPPSWRDRPEDSVSDSGDVTSASGGGVVSEGDPVAVEMREVLVCVVEQLEGVVKRQASSDGDSS